MCIPGADEPGDDDEEADNGGTATGQGRHDGGYPVRLRPAALQPPGEGMRHPRLR